MDAEELKKIVGSFQYLNGQNTTLTEEELEGGWYFYSPDVTHFLAYGWVNFTRDLTQTKQ